MTIRELEDLTEELITEVSDRGHGNFSARAKEIVAELAEKARKTEIYQQNREKEQDFWTGKETARSVYMHMVRKIAGSPTKLHAYGAVLLCMPKLDELLNGAKERK